MSDESLEEALDALQHMLYTYHLMMEKVDHGSSFYDAETIKAMNDAPLQAEDVLERHGRSIEPSELKPTVQP